MSKVILEREKEWTVPKAWDASWRWFDWCRILRSGTGRRPGRSASCCTASRPPSCPGSPCRGCCRARDSPPSWSCPWTRTRPLRRAAASGRTGAPAAPSAGSSTAPDRRHLISTHKNSFKKRPQISKSIKIKWNTKVKIKSPDSHEKNKKSGQPRVLMGFEEHWRSSYDSKNREEIPLDSFLSRVSKNSRTQIFDDQVHRYVRRVSFENQQLRSHTRR